MSNLANQSTFITKEDPSILGSLPSQLGTPSEPIGAVYSATGTINNIITTTVNGIPYPPPVPSVFVDDVTFIVDAVDDTIRIGFDASGAPGTTTQLRFTQAANREFTFPEVGANSDVILSEGTQTIGGVKTFNDNAIVIADAVDPTIATQFSLNGAAGTTATLVASQAADRNYTFTDPGADTDIFITEGAQVINGTKTFVDTALNIVDAVDNTIGLAFDASGAAGTTGTIQLSQTSNRTYSFPDPGADTDVFLTAGTQTVTGDKQFADNAFIIASSGDPTVTHRFEVNGAAATDFVFAANASPSRTYTFPDPGLDAGVVTEVDTQPINGIKLFSQINVNDIVEATLDNGVVLNGVLIQQDAFSGVKTGSITRRVGGGYVVLSPKGNGAILMNPPDNTALNGGPRGLQAIDLQITRTAVTQIAAGDYSILLGGANNTTNSNDGGVFVGFANLEDGNNDCAILGGELNTINGNLGCAILAGTGNLNSGFSYTAIAGGSGNTALGGAIVGGDTNLAADDNFVLCGSNNSSLASLGCIVAGNSNNVEDATRCGIFGGTNNQMVNTLPDWINCAIFGGSANQFGTSPNALNTTNCAIVGGNNNVIREECTNSSIFGGAANDMISECLNSSILGGSTNTMERSGGIGPQKSIITASSNCNITGGSIESTILACTLSDITGVSSNCIIAGGTGHLINGASKSAILGGINNTITSDDSLTLGNNSTITQNNGVVIGTGSITATTNTILINGTRLLLAGGGSTWLQDHPNDGAAAAGLIPLHGLYRTNSEIKIRMV